MNQFKDRGMILISVLLVTVVLLILTSSMMVMHYNNLGFTNIMERQVAARKVAEAGVAYAIYALKDDPSWTGGPAKKIVYSMPDVDGKFMIDFDPNCAYPSVNNLLNGAISNAGYKQEGVPGFSVDIIVTGSVNYGNGDVVKRIRVILQGESYYDAALASGQINTNASLLDVSKEDPNDPNTPKSGTMHSNSVKLSTDPRGPAINNSNPSVNIKLHGGIASAQGDINIDPNTQLDATSSIDPHSQGRHMTPIDINQSISDAESNILISKVSVTKKSYVVKNDKVYEGDDPNSLVEVHLPDTYVDKGQLHIQKDIVFENKDVRFEFDHKDFKDSGLSDSDIAKTGIYMDSSDPNKVPSVYVSGGNLTVAGPIKGNGSFYVSGAANYIGESNLVAPGDPGVAVLCNSNLNMELPSVSGKSLKLDMTGLIYTHGNANIAILDPSDTTNPVNNFAGGGWPADWENTYLGGITPFELTGIPHIIFTGSSDSTITKDLSGNYTLSPDGSGTVTLTYEDGAGIHTVTTTDPIVIGATSITVNGVTPPGFESMSIAITLHSIIQTLEPDTLQFPYHFVAGSSGSGPKVDPEFHITGGLVSIDPNNPVPTTTNPDDPNFGNINININGGQVFIVSSERYLKLLHVVKSGSDLRFATWSDI